MKKRIALAAGVTVMSLALGGCFEGGNKAQCGANNASAPAAAQPGAAANPCAAKNPSAPKSQ